MAKTVTKEQSNKQLEKELKREFTHWTYIMGNGSNDPFWPDGTGLNLTRNHIIYFKKKCEEANFFPPAYYLDLPPEVPWDYKVKKVVFEINNKNQLTLFGMM